MTIAALRLTAVVAVGTMLTLSGCGQKGPLYLPDKKATVVSGSVPAPAPAPEPQSAPEQTLPPAPALPAEPQKKDGPDSDSQTPQ